MMFAMWIIIALVIVGVALLVAELLLLPGITVAGVGAIIAFVAAVVLSYTWFGPLAGVLCLMGIIGLATVAVILSLRSGTWSKLTLEGAMEGTSTSKPQQFGIKIGDEGYALTRLAPMGKVTIGDKTIEAKSLDSYIDAKSRVEVIGYDNTSVIVKKL